MTRGNRVTSPCYQIHAGAFIEHFGVFSTHALRGSENLLITVGIMLTPCTKFSTGSNFG